MEAARIPVAMVQVITLVVRHDCPFSEPVVREAGARVTHLCHRGDEAILEVHGDGPGAVERLQDEYRRIGGEVIYQEEDGSAALVRFPECACCRNGRMIPTIEGMGHLYLPPTAYTGEGEHYQFLAREARLDSRLSERLASGVTVVRAGTKPLTAVEFEGGFLVPVAALSRGLTDRQRRAIVTAILRGYYRIPRAVRAEEIARDFGVSRPAFDALLRKAEAKLATALFPYLAVHSVGRRGEAAEAAVGRGRRPSPGRVRIH